MAMSHKQLPIDQVMPGMVLADQICNAVGTVLLVPGTVMSEAILTSLHRHQIESLPILFEITEGEDPTQNVQEQCARIEHLFRKHAADDASPMLKSLLLHYRAGEAA
ncbi:MAG: hypothetical protein HYZ45_05850 [Burkholderiales bacterium]|nr:hypothetical protein [Burkholderiales bacterium]